MEQLPKLTSAEAGVLAKGAAVSLDVEVAIAPITVTVTVITVCQCDHVSSYEKSKYNAPDIQY